MNWKNMTGLEQCWQDKLPIPPAVHVTITGSQDRSLVWHFFYHLCAQLNDAQTHHVCSTCFHYCTNFTNFHMYANYKTAQTSVPSVLNSSIDIAASRDIVVRSPRLAAIGVATLSGLIWNRRESRITQAIAEPNNNGGQTLDVSCKVSW